MGKIDADRSRERWGKKTNVKDCKLSKFKQERQVISSDVMT